MAGQDQTLSVARDSSPREKSASPVTVGGGLGPWGKGKTDWRGDFEKQVPTVLGGSGGVA